MPTGAFDAAARPWRWRLEHAEPVRRIRGNLLADVPHLHDPAVLEAQDVDDDDVDARVAAAHMGKHRHPVAGFDDLPGGERLVGLDPRAFLHSPQQRFPVLGEVRVVVAEIVRNVGIVGLPDLAGRAHGQETGGFVRVALNGHGRSVQLASVASPARRREPQD